MSGLETKRFVLRDFEPADVAALAAYQADPRFVSARRKAGQAAGDPAELVALFRQWAAENPRKNHQFAVICRKTGRLVGCSGLRAANCPQDSGELGIELSPDLWGRYGSAAEIAGALLDFGFSELGLVEIFGDTTAENHQAARLASFLGAQPETVEAAAKQGAESGSAPVRWRFSHKAWRARDGSRPGARPKWMSGD